MTISTSTRSNADRGIIAIHLAAEAHRCPRSGRWYVDLLKNGELLAERVSLLEVASTLRTCGVPRDVAGRFDRKILAAVR
jgi:hypothetical protein